MARAQEPPPERKTIEVEPLIEEVHEALGLGLDVPIRWIVAVERGLTVEADHDQLFRVLVNVARNAMQALEARGARDPARDQIRITGRREGSVVVIEVSDTGPGVSEKARAHLFQAFQGSDPRRRHRPWSRHRRRTGARAWRRNPAGAGHHRRDLQHHHSRPRGRSRFTPRRTRPRLSDARTGLATTRCSFASSDVASHIKEFHMAAAGECCLRSRPRCRRIELEQSAVAAVARPHLRAKLRTLSEARRCFRQCRNRAALFGASARMVQ